MTTHFIVHDKHDTVGVVVTEDVKPGMEVTGWVMETEILLKMTMRVETQTLRTIRPISRC